MAALGMGVERETFTSRMQGGAHLLAPTGSDLQKNDVGAVFAGFHYDISFMTIHGKSRYPGLSVWTRDWKKRAVKIPQGCLLVQAGTSFENISGGYVLGGFHEVIYTEATKAAVERRNQIWAEEGVQNRKQWRVSSTMFCHFRNDVMVGPLAELSHLYTPE
jgi:isopenicillin N synthase-like dioxygenase